jgi:acyl carrier protein
VEQVYSAGAVERVYNIYGPTEETVDTTWGLVARGTARPTIGRPLPGTRCYILDPHLRPVPRGARGELYLAGPKLARGYAHRPRLTAQRFLPDPFVPGQRMYRTGDQVRLRNDGELEYFGRLDRQVKVRGARVELGEIEHALAGQPGVAQAAAVVRPDAAGRPRLSAYVVRSSAPWDERAVRARLRARLPEYMVPEHITLVESLPRNANGKLDEAALPGPVATARPAPTPPRTPIEAELASLWQEVLGIGEIGVHDNFFDLGGTSFGLISLRARIAERLATQLTLTGLYAYPTVAGLAEHLSSGPDPQAGPTGAGTGKPQAGGRNNRALLEQRRRRGNRDGG